MRLLPYGDRAVLVELNNGAETRQFASLLRRSDLPELGETVAAARTVLAVAAENVGVGELRRALDGVAGRAAGFDDRDVVDPDVLVVPVVYDGADLDDVATLTGLSPDEVVAAHTGQRWQVAFGGFAPGFGYLVGENDSLRVPRRDESRTRVPPGSVGLADEYSGVYPRESPGGWQLIGHTDLVLFDLDREPPALLRPGVLVHFESVDG